MMLVLLIRIRVHIFYLLFMFVLCIYLGNYIFCNLNLILIFTLYEEFRCKSL